MEENEMKCPFCGCQSFYLKDPDDEYETYEFDLEKGEVNFHSEVNESDAPELREKTRCYCNQCAWNGNFGELKNSGG
jgi:hypothetical protein